jgi:hypothetical protein
MAIFTKRKDTSQNIYLTKLEDMAIFTKRKDTSQNIYLTRLGSGKWKMETKKGTDHSHVRDDRAAPEESQKRLLRRG